MHIYIPLYLRLTFFFALVLGLALWSFSSLTYTQAEQRANLEVRNALQSRANSVRLGKNLFYNDQPAQTGANQQPITLPSVDSLGTGGVAIEVLDSQLRLLASTNSSNDPQKTSVDNLGTSYTPWDSHAARQLLHQSTLNGQNGVNNGIYTTVTYAGQDVLVYTTLNNPFATNGDIHIIQTARSLAEMQQALAALQQLLLHISILVMLLTAGGTWLISWGVLTSVRRMTGIAQVISNAQDFSKRVPAKSWLGRHELNTLATTFNQMLKRLEEAYQHQQRFIADASHELRAPITSIRCNLDLLSKAPDLPPVEVQAALAETRAEAERMGRLVNDLLLLAHADEAQQGHTHDYRKTGDQIVDLDSLLLAVFRQYRLLQELADGKDEEAQGPHLQLQHIVPVQVCGQEDQLKQALVALVDNALKYTPREGYVRLALAIEQDCAVIKVSDTGIGIATEDREHIFERFYRANRAHTRDRGGSGLGLAIVQSIMREHHGSVEVASIPGKGSTFTLRIPAYACER